MCLILYNHRLSSSTYYFPHCFLVCTVLSNLFHILPIVSNSIHYFILYTYCIASYSALYCFLQFVWYFALLFQVLCILSSSTYIIHILQYFVLCSENYFIFCLLFQILYIILSTTYCFLLYFQLCSANYFIFCLLLQILFILSSSTYCFLLCLVLCSKKYCISCF